MYRFVDVHIGPHFCLHDVPALLLLITNFAQKELIKLRSDGEESHLFENTTALELSIC